MIAGFICKTAEANPNASAREKQEGVDSSPPRPPVSVGRNFSNLLPFETIWDWK